MTKFIKISLVPVVVLLAFSLNTSKTPQEGIYYGYALMGNGHIESPGKQVEPAGLFIQQLIDRIGKEQAMKVLQ